MSHKIRVCCSEKEKSKILIDLITSAAYYGRKNIDIQERGNWLEFVWEMFCPELYLDYLKRKYEGVSLKYLGM